MLVYQRVSHASNQWGLTLAGKRLLFMFENELILALQVLEDGDLRSKKHQRSRSFRRCVHIAMTGMVPKTGKEMKRMEIQIMSLVITGPKKSFWY